MKPSKILLALLFTSAIYSCNQHPKRAKVINGLIPDGETAVDVAKAILKAQYGDDIYEDEPYIATMKDSIWSVTGTLHAEHGGAYFVEMHSKNAAILAIGYAK